MNVRTLSATTLGSRVAGQGALLFSVFTLAQAFSFARNALIGYWLSKADFGIAVTLTLALQLLETLSDLGADRLIVQAEDGDDPRLMGAAHATLVMRGLLTAGILFLAASPLTRFFDVESAQGAFELAALVPIIKGFMHLDARRRQRRLENRSYLIIEAAPQALAFLLTAPALIITTSYYAVLWLAILQAVLTVLTSHLIAERPYSVNLDTACLERLAAFGWPIWLSAFPLIAVYYGDRVVIGRLLGMEALAGFSAAFMVTMVPGLIAAKVGHALMLPLLAETKGDAISFSLRAKLMAEGTVLLAAAYLIVFVVAGGDIVRLAFGPNYAGLGTVVAWLGAMWALRMVQAVPGMALMALGNTRPLLTAGLLRALALAPVILAASAGGGLSMIAAAGAASEVASLTYVAWRLGRERSGLTRALLLRALFLVLASAAAFALRLALPAGAPLASLSAAGVLAVALTVGGLLLMPGIRNLMEEHQTRGSTQIVEGA